MENKELNIQDTVMTPDVYKKTFWRTFPLQLVSVLKECRT